MWKDKRIKPETKIIYSYIYAKGFNNLLLHIDIGEIQKVIRIKKVGFKKNLLILEKFKYILFKEYDNGMYLIHIL